MRSSATIGDTCSIGFMGNSNLALNQTPCTHSSPPERVQPKSANREVNILEGVSPENSISEAPKKGSGINEKEMVDCEGDSR